MEQFSISLSFPSLGSEYGFGRLLLFVLLLTVTEGPDYSSRYFRCIGAHITCTYAHVQLVHMMSHVELILVYNHYQLDLLSSRAKDVISTLFTYDYFSLAL